jgi:hypothetical protein
MSKSSPKLSVSPKARATHASRKSQYTYYKEGYLELRTHLSGMLKDQEGLMADNTYMKELLAKYKQLISMLTQSLEALTQAMLKMR